MQRRANALERRSLSCLGMCALRTDALGPVAGENRSSEKANTAKALTCFTSGEANALHEPHASEEHPSKQAAKLHMALNLSSNLSPVWVHPLGLQPDSTQRQ